MIPPMVRLADVSIRIGSGVTPRGGSIVYKRSGRPFVRSQNIGWGELKLNDIAYLDDATHMTFPATEIRTGDVLLNITGASIGRSAVATADLDGGNVNQHVCEIRLKPRVMDPYYVNAFLLSRAGQEQIDAFQAGGNRQGLNFQQVGSIELPAPPIDHQRAIGVASRDADRLIASLEQLITKKQAIKQGMMQELLSGRTRLPGFSEVWSRGCSIAQVCSRSSGYWGTDRPKSSGDVLARVVRAGDISPRGRLLGWADRYLTPEEWNKASCKKDDVVVTTSGNGLGKSYYVCSDKRLSASNFVRILRPRAGTSGEFIRYLLQTNKAAVKLETHTATSAYPNLLPSFFLDTWFDLPELREQLAIAGALRSVDDELDCLTARLGKARDIKQGMMQELLTGRTRLPVSEAVA